MMALSNLGQTRALAVYADTLSGRLRENAPETAVARQKAALALIAAGRPDDPFVKRSLDDSIGVFGIMGDIFGLHLLTNSPSSASASAAARDVISRLVSLGLPGGGWALAGTNPDVDITAMAVQALAPYYGTGDSVKAAIDDAVALLAEKQRPDGGFSAYGFPNAESAAQVILALTSLGINPVEDSRFQKNGENPYRALLRYRLSDGSFCHTEGGKTNPAATVQALCALVSLWRFDAGFSPFYLFENETDPDKKDQTDTSEAHSKEPSSAEKQSEPAAHTGGESEETRDTLSSPQDKKAGVNYKIIGSGAVAFLFIAVILTLIRKKKYKLKYYLLPFILAAAAIACIFTLHFQSAKEYYGNLPPKTNAIGTVTLQIHCEEIMGERKNSFVPSDGIILPETQFDIAPGDTVYDILVEGVRRFSLHMEKRGVSGYGYVVAIQYIYEYEYGDLAGWRYLVNGSFPTVGCMEYELSDGDLIEWVYTKNLLGYVD